MKSEKKKIKPSICDSYFLSLFSQMDLFGVKYSPTLFSNDKNKSIIGAILTIILAFLAIGKIILTIYHIIKKDKFRYKHETFTDIDNYINISNFHISICADDSFSVIDNLITHNITQENFSTYSEGELIPRDNITGYECLKYDLENFTLKDSNLELNQTYIYYMFRVEKNNTNSFFNLRFDFPKIYPSIKNFKNPLGNRTSHAFINSAYSKGKALKVYLDKLQVKYQNRYGFGIFESPATVKNYTILNSFEVIDNLGLFSYYGYNTIEVFYTGWTQSYTFIGYDIEEEISSIGGFLNVCFVILSFIGGMTNNLFLTASIKRNLQTDFKASFRTNTNTSKKSNKVNVNSNSQNQHLIGNSNSQFSPIHNLKEIQKNNIGLNTNNTNVNTNTNLNSNNYYEINENRENKESYIKKPLLINIKSINNKTNEQRDNIDIYSQYFKNEINIKNDYNIRKVDSTFSRNIHFTSKRFIVSEVNQFLNSMDYGLIYNLIKDVILLEFLVLTPRNAKLFYQLRTAPFNLFDLDEQLSKISNSKEYKVLADEKFKLDLFENCFLKNNK